MQRSNDTDSKSVNEWSMCSLANELKLICHWQSFHSQKIVAPRSKVIKKPDDHVFGFGLHPVGCTVCEFGPGL